MAHGDLGLGPALIVHRPSIEGALSHLVHSHSFEAADTGTRVTDRVDYRLPFWPLGEVALPFVCRKVGRIFAYREKVIREILF